MNPDIWLFNLETFEAKNITRMTPRIPSRCGMVSSFISFPIATKTSGEHLGLRHEERQVPAGHHLRGVRRPFPEHRAGRIVFENGGRLYLLDLATKNIEVNIQVVTDRATLKPRLEDVSRIMRNPDISPSGKRAVFEARGEMFTIPAEHGVVRNLTRSSGVAERYPRVVARWEARSLTSAIVPANMS